MEGMAGRWYDYAAGPAIGIIYNISWPPGASHWPPTTKLKISLVTCLPSDQLGPWIAAACHIAAVFPATLVNARRPHARAGRQHAVLNCCIAVGPVSEYGASVCGLKGYAGSPSPRLPVSPSPRLPVSRFPSNARVTRSPPLRLSEPFLSRFQQDRWKATRVAPSARKERSLETDESAYSSRVSAPSPLWGSIASPKWCP